MDIISSSDFELNGFQGYSVKFSPFNENLLAVSASQNYGISGSGLFAVLNLGLDLNLKCVYQAPWQDGLFDIIWSENNADIAVTASGDSSIQVWNINGPEKPLQILWGHTKEVYSLDWNLDRASSLIISGSWDGTVKLWDLVTCELKNTFDKHKDLVYSTLWSPHNQNVFASCSADQSIKVWDIQTPSEPAININAHTCHILSVDWCKYDSNILISGGVEGLIRGWDIRSSNQPLFQLVGHEAAVRRVKFSPFNKSQLGSVSYDFTTRLWDWSDPHPSLTLKHHSEFVYGLDFSTLKEGKVADCAWDNLVKVFTL